MSKTARLEIRLSESEKVALFLKARQAGLTVTDWIRARCTGNEPLDDPNRPDARTESAEDGRCARCQRLGINGCAACPKNQPKGSPMQA